MQKPDLEALSILFGQDAGLLDALQSRCRVRVYRRGESILHQQDETDDVHYMLQGKAKAYVFSADGREVWLNEFTPGDMFGEIAAISGAPRVCSVAAFDHVTTACFRGRVFLELMQEYGELGIIVARILSQRLYVTSQRLYMAHVESLEGRIIAELLKRSSRGDDDTEGLHIIQPAPVIADIARKVGSARESVSRIVAELCKRGYIERSDSAWLLREPEKLVALNF